MHTQCTYGMFGREFTKYTVIHGAYIRYFGRDATIYTVIHGVHTVFLQKYHHIYDHIRCMYGIFGRDTTKERPYTVHIHGSGQPCLKYCTYERQQSSNACFTPSLGRALIRPHARTIFPPRPKHSRVESI